MMRSPLTHDVSRTGSMAASGWSTNATHALIAIWGEVNVQKRLDSVTRNIVIYEEIVEKMRAEGFNYSWEQCRTKAKNLTQKYRKVLRL